MKAISLINHSKGAIGLRFFGLGPNLKPTNGLNKLQKLLDRNAFWAQSRTINDLKKCLANSDASLLARHFFRSFIVLLCAQKAFLSSNFCSLFNPFVGFRLGPNPKNLNPIAPFEWFIRDIAFIF